mmetsp:Transcript_72081/g.165134  ORF Transcript_72081/g.165134 Transcript_72081/m.165134 type:complete len:305 (+) Transcript_72081:357-1271(+)
MHVAQPRQHHLVQPRAPLHRARRPLARPRHRPRFGRALLRGVHHDVVRFLGALFHGQFPRGHETWQRLGRGPLLGCEQIRAGPRGGAPRDSRGADRRRGVGGQLQQLLHRHRPQHLRRAGVGRRLARDTGPPLRSGGVVLDAGDVPERRRPRGRQTRRRLPGRLLLGPFLRRRRPHRTSRHAPRFAERLQRPGHRALRQHQHLDPLHRGAPRRRRQGQMRLRQRLCFLRRRGDNAGQRKCRGYLSDDAPHVVYGRTKRRGDHHNHTRRDDHLNHRSSTRGGHHHHGIPLRFGHYRRWDRHFDNS